MKYLAVAIAFTMGGFLFGLLYERGVFEHGIFKQGISKQESFRENLTLSSEQLTDVRPLRQPGPMIGRSFTFDDIASQPHVFQQLFVAFELAASADTDELERMLDQSIQSVDPLYNRNLVSIFIERFSMLDPLAAISYIESHPRFDRHRFIPDVVTSWIRQDPSGAMDYFRTLQNPRMIEVMGARLLTDPTIRDSGLITEIARYLGPKADDIVTRARLNALTPPQAFEEAIQISSDYQSMHLAVTRWARHDPEALIARIDEIAVVAERTRLRAMAYSLFAASDATAALAHVRNYHPDTAGLEELVLKQITRYDPDAAQPLIEEYLSRSKSSSLLGSLLVSLVNADSAEALAYAATLTDAEKLSAYPALANAYVRAHPAEAFNWALNLEEKYRQATWITFNHINNQTLEYAEQVIDKIDDPKLRIQTITNIAGFKSNTDPEAALDWLSSYQQDPAYKSALQNVIATWAHRDPVNAAREIETRLDDADMSPIASQVAQAWYRRDINAAVNWVSSLPEGEPKYRALSSIASIHVNEDPTEAIAMIDNIPMGRIQTQAKLSIAYSWASREPGRVDEIIETLNLEKTEAERIRQISKRASGLTVNSTPYIVN